MFENKKINLDFLDTRHIYNAIEILKGQSKQRFSKVRLDYLDLEIIARKENYLKNLSPEEFRAEILQDGQLNPKIFRHATYTVVKKDGSPRQEDIFCIYFYIIYYAISLYLLELNEANILNLYSYPKTYIESGVTINFQKLQESKSFTERNPSALHDLINEELAKNVNSGLISCLKLDIRCFFASIDHHRIARVTTDKLALNSQVAKTTQMHVRNSVETFLSCLTHRTCGIPSSLNNIASFILASLYLLPFDMYIHGRREKYSVLSYFRWVDDVVFLINHPHDTNLVAVNTVIGNFYIEISSFLKQELGLEFHAIKQKHEVFRVK